MKTQGQRKSSNVEDRRGQTGQEPKSILDKILGVLSDSADGLSNVGNAAIGLATTGDATNTAMFGSNDLNPFVSGMSLDESFGNALSQIQMDHTKDVQGASVLSGIYNLIRSGK